MKRVSHVVLLAMFSLLLLGSTSAFAGDGHGRNNQGQNNQGNNNQGNGGGGLLNLIEGIINDIFGTNQGNNNQGNNQGDNQGTSNGGSWTNGGGGTAPIDGGLSLLLVAGVGLGIRKMAGRRNDA